MVVGIFVQQFAGSDRDVKVGRKKFKAISALTSIASDIDLIADWWFYATVKTEITVPPFLKTLQFSFCMVGLITWLIVASDGHLIKPISKRFNVCFTTGHLLLMAVILEDIPQLLITLFIDKKIDNNSYAAINLMTSGYDIFIKLAEAYDERYDLHDTGGWLVKEYLGHKRSVTALTDVNDKMFLSGSIDKTLKLWHTGSKQEKNPIRTFKGHNHRITSVAIGLDGNTIISGSWDESVKLWDLHTGKCLRTLLGHTDAVTSVIALDSNKIVSGSFDNTSILWDTDTGRRIHTFTGHEYRVNSIAKIDEVRVVTGSSDLTAKLWNTVTGKCIQTFVGHSQSVTSVAFGEVDVLLTSSSDFTAKMWSIATGHCLRTFSDEKKMFSSILNFDKNTFLTTSENYTLKLWEKKTGFCLRTFQHASSILCVAKLSDQTILTGSSDKIIRQWSITRVAEKKENEKNPHLSISIEDTEPMNTNNDNIIAKVVLPQNFHHTTSPTNTNITTTTSSSSTKDNYVNNTKARGENPSTQPSKISPIEPKKKFWHQLDIHHSDEQLTEFELEHSSMAEEETLPMYTMITCGSFWTG